MPSPKKMIDEVLSGKAPSQVIEADMQTQTQKGFAFNTKFEKLLYLDQKPGEAAVKDVIEMTNSIFGGLRAAFDIVAKKYSGADKKQLAKAEKVMDKAGEALARLRL